MRTFIRGLEVTEGGKRFLLNLHDGLVGAQDIPSDTAKRFLSAAAATAAELGPDNSSWHPLGGALSATVFTRPHSYQFKGPTSTEGNGHWMTIKSAADIGELILDSPWLAVTAARQHFRPYDLGGSFIGLSDDDHLRFAELVNDPTLRVRFRLARAFHSRALRRSGRNPPRPAPIWLSRWCLFKSAYPAICGPSADLAGRLRDWLGLSQYEAGTPLFALRARYPFDIRSFGGRRPTVLDGISNPIFKHRTERYRDGCGASADIELLRQRPRHPDVLDGGPEILARRIWFHPRRFECVYLGRAPELRYDPYAEFHLRLLDSRDFNGIVNAISGVIAA